MTKKDKLRKLKIAGLVAFLAGSIVVGKTVMNTKSKQPTQKEMTQEEISIRQMELFIEKSNELIAELDSVMNSETVDPEEKFEATVAYPKVVKERDDMQKKLDAARAKQQATIDYKTAKEL